MTDESLNAWPDPIWSPLFPHQRGTVHFDMRIKAPIPESDGRLVVCDTFKEFAPVLLQAMPLKHRGEELVAAIEKGVDVASALANFKSTLKACKSLPKGKL